jgi:putative FmdB family regulatory protein
MPTYEYRCKDCGHEFEEVQSFTDDPITVCPTCGGTVKKRFGNVGISFKGSGFYKTDTRGSGSSTSSSAGSATSSSSGSDSGSSSGSDGGSSSSTTSSSSDAGSSSSSSTSSDSSGSTASASA